MTDAETPTGAGRLDTDVRATANEGPRRWLDPENAATPEDAADIDPDEFARPT